MKKIVLFAAALFAVSAVSAQTGEITSNRGENWLSQDGDWAITFDAAPLLNYAGTLFNNGNNSNVMAMNNMIASRGYQYSDDGAGRALNVGGVVIGGKKLIDANTAYRGQVRLGFGSHKETELVNVVPAPNPAPAYPNPMPQVEDVTKEGYMAVQLGAGIEKRFGSTRVVGVYGGELNFGIGSGKTTYEYGNALSNDNQNSRPTEEKAGSAMGFGLNGFIGVEWFAAPKISLSGEYTWGLSMNNTGHTEVTTEYWVPSTSTPNTGSVQSVTVEAGTKHSDFSIDTGVSGARIGVNFYFQ